MQFGAFLNGENYCDTLGINPWTAVQRPTPCCI